MCKTFLRNSSQYTAPSHGATDETVFFFSAQAALECLLQEKAEEQAKIADLQARLLQASEAARAAEAEARAAQSRLERAVPNKSNEKLDALAAAAPPPPPATAVLDAGRLQARLDGLRVAVEEEEAENGVEVRCEFPRWLTEVHCSFTSVMSDLAVTPGQKPAGRFKIGTSPLKGFRLGEYNVTVVSSPPVFSGFSRGLARG